jgi:hypothetical protein
MCQGTADPRSWLAGSRHRRRRQRDTVRRRQPTTRRRRAIELRGRYPSTPSDHARLRETDRGPHRAHGELATVGRDPRATLCPSQSRSVRANIRPFAPPCLPHDPFALPSRHDSLFRTVRAMDHRQTTVRSIRPAGQRQNARVTLPGSLRRQVAGRARKTGGGGLKNEWAPHAIGCLVRAVAVDQRAIRGAGRWPRAQLLPQPRLELSAETACSSRPAFLLSLRHLLRALVARRVARCFTNHRRPFDW